MENFKVGDRVYHIQYGWGEVEANIFDDVINQQIYHVHVRFLDNNVSFTLDGKEFEEDKQPLLSFTEYTLQGFSQERPIELPKVGELCLVSNSQNFEDFKLGFFKEYKDGFFKVEHHSLIGTYWTYLKRIKILD